MTPVVSSRPLRKAEKGGVRSGRTALNRLSINYLCGTGRFGQLIKAARLQIVTLRPLMDLRWFRPATLHYNIEVLTFYFLLISLLLISRIGQRHRRHSPPLCAFIHPLLLFHFPFDQLHQCPAPADEYPNSTVTTIIPLIYHAHFNKSNIVTRIRSIYYFSIQCAFHRKSILDISTYSLLLLPFNIPANRWLHRIYHY